MKAAPPTARLFVCPLLVMMAFSSVVVVSGRARAQVRQPSGEVMPRMPPMSEVNIARDRGYQLVGGFSVVTLEALFSVRGETLSPINDAHTTPGAFSPLCSFKGQ